MKLNLASGTDIRDGWVNLDAVAKWPLARRGCDILWDARKDKIPFLDGVVQEVYAGYLLLHLAPRFHGLVLDDIRRVLMDGGTLTVGEVDMGIVMERWIANPNDSRLSELIWGEQGVVENVEVSGDQLELEAYDKHCHGFTEEALCALLSSHGFGDFKRIQIHSPDVFYELTITCRKV